MFGCIVIDIGDYFYTFELVTYSGWADYKARKQFGLTSIDLSHDSNH